MFCRYCGFSLPRDSVFCSECGKSLSVPPLSSSATTILDSTESSPDSPVSLPSDRTRNKKQAAIALIVFFSLWQLSTHARSPQIAKGDLAALAGFLIGVTIRVVGLILSIKWLVKLNGYAKTSGRQALAIFLIVFCVYGMILIGLFAIGPGLDAAAIVLGVIYVAGLFLCIRWVKKLRHSEQTHSPLADTE